LTDQPDGTRAKTCRHLGEVLLRHLAHRAIELQLLDRPQRQRLLALERRPCTPAEDGRAGRLVRRRDRRKRSPRRDADRCRGEDGQAEKDDGRRRLAARHEDHERRAREAGQRKELPGL
jgi:hypothetical protein